jgi:hypothetical protein
MMTDNNIEPLTPTEVLVIPYIEEFWHKHGYFPPPTELKKRGVSNMNAMCQKPAFIKAMENRGIRIPASVDAPVDLSKAQLAAIITMTDYLDRRNAASKLKTLGLTTTQWNAWMRDEKFKNYVHDLSAKGFVDGVHMAQVGLAKKLEDGDVNAIKYYYEVTGRYQGGDSGNQQHVRLIITRLVEVLQRRIKDSDLLAEIGRDFEIILSGGTPVTQIPAESVLPGVNGDI